jgi:hypothetical protein
MAKRAIALQAIHENAIFADPVDEMKKTTADPPFDFAQGRLFGDDN